MGMTMRVSLPGYNALTDTNIDHFALYSDEDWVLIKEKNRGSTTIASNGEGIIAHNLGYIPFFLVYGLEPSSNVWYLIPNLTATVSVPEFYAYADTNNIHIFNYSGSSTQFKYYIFYDNIVGSSANDIDLSGPLLAVGKAGIDVTTEKDPNNFIFHSNFNTLKILKEGNANITYSSDGYYSIAHNLANYTATSIMVFIKFPDGYTALLPGYNRCLSKDGNWWAGTVDIDGTNINFYLSRISGSATALSIKYYIFETPLA